MSTQETSERPQQRRRQLTVASVAAAVLLAGGGGALWASNASGPGPEAGPGGPGEPAPLVLDGLGQEERGDAPDGAVAPGEPNPHGGPVYRAVGELPEGPDTAPVHRPRGSVAKAEVAAIAEALGIAGTPEPYNGSWRVGGGQDGSAPTLTVGDSRMAGTWSFVRHLPSGDAKCGTPPEGARTLPAPCPEPDPGSGGDPVSAQKAKKAVGPALKALDLTGAKLDASSTNGALRMVKATPEAGGLPTHDWTSAFTVGANGELVRGHGHLGGLVEGDAYPVMSAQETLKELNKQRGAAASAPMNAPRSAPGSAPPCDAPPPAPEEPDKDGDGPGDDVVACTPAAPDPRPRTAEVTGATFGLATQYSKGEAILVPSWIYEVRQQGGTGGSTGYEVTFPAVEPEYLAPAGRGSGSDPGDAPTAEPGPSRPGTGGQALSSYSVDGRTLSITFWGGVCHDYTATAEETGSKVTVAVQPKNPDPEKVCIKIAKKQTVQVGLDEPLGDREVVDERSGDPLPRKK